MVEPVEFLVSLVVTTALVIGIVVWDERRLDEDALDRAWPSTTRVAAAVAFGPLCLPVHFWRTRRSFGGFLMGIGFALLVVAVNVGIAMLIELVIPE